MRHYSKHTNRQIESIATDRASQYDSQLVDNAIYEAISFDEQLADMIEIINQLDEQQFQRSRSVEDSRQDPIVEAFRSARFELDQSNLIRLRSDEIEQETLRHMHDNLIEEDPDNLIEEALTEIEERSLDLDLIEEVDR